MTRIEFPIRTPEKSTAFIKNKGCYYLATEEDVRHLQLMVLQGFIDPQEYIVCDIDVDGWLYELKWRFDGKFYNDFTSDIMSFNSNIVFEMISDIRKDRSVDTNEIKYYE